MSIVGIVQEGAQAIRLNLMQYSGRGRPTEVAASGRPAGGAKWFRDVLFWRLRCEGNDNTTILALVVRLAGIGAEMMGESVAADLWFGSNAANGLPPSCKRDLPERSTNEHS
jgi:hypothetical protein